MKLAAADCGTEVVEGQTTHRWYGHWVGDWPLPKGLTEDQIGKCDHAIRVIGNDRAYEIGLTRIQGENGEEFRLSYDFWNGGYGLEEKVGKGCEKLMSRYSYHAATRKAASLGWSLKSEQVQEDGSLKLEFTPAPQMAWSGAGQIW